MIKKINLKIRRSDDASLFHDSRADCRNLAMVCNELIEKVNELTEEVNRLSNKD